MAESKINLNQRRLRQSRWIRELVQEHRITVDQFIQPLFVVENLPAREPVPGLTGTYRETQLSLLKTIESDLEAGVRKFLLFGVPEEKRNSDFENEFISDQIQSIRKRFGKDLFLAVDLCLCSSTPHGHCGILSPSGDQVENRSTVYELQKLGVKFAQAGADCIAPSDMMDGRVGAIRMGLEQADLDQTLIMSYSAKFHSKFYGPFRVAADSAPKGKLQLKDRATYQIDPAAPRDALLSSLRNEKEGADILMVKPGLPYLYILADLSSRIQKPWAVYEVSGEYAAVEVLAERGLIDAPAAHLEAWTAFVRAGASIIISYGSRYVQEYLKRNSS